MTPSSERHSKIRVLAFASIGMPLAAVGLPMAVFIAPMYAEQLGLGTALVGLIFMSLRFWDMVTDPIMGWLVDTKPTRRGYVKHWILASVPVLMLATIFIYMPQGETVHPFYLVIWLTVFWVGYTMLQTPHQAWVPLITSEYDERSRFFMWREIIMTATLLALLIIPTVLSQTHGLDRREAVMVMGFILLALLPLTTAFATFVVPDVAPEPDKQRLTLSWSIVRVAFSNPAVVRIIFIEILVGLAISGSAATFLFAAKWGFGVVGMAPAILAAFFVSGFLAMPFWIWLSKRTEKHVALIAVCLWSLVTSLLYLPLSAYETGAYGLLVGAVITGAGYGTPFILVRSMMADVIEQAQVESGEVRAGLYYSIMTGAYKIGAALAIGIPYILLEWVVGFDAAGNNDPVVAQGVLYVFIGVPVIAYVLASIASRNYPLTRAVQAAAAAKLYRSKG